MRSTAPVFYSPLQKAIATAPARADNQPANQWVAWLKANASKMGVKHDEIEWSGVMDWLNLQGTNKVSKDNVLAYLDQNGVKVDEVLKGAPIAELPVGWSVEQDRYGNWVVNNERGVSVTTPQRTKEHALEVVPKSASPTKYSQYVLSGGENYRELLLTLPFKDNAPTFEQWNESREFRGDALGSRAEYEKDVGYYRERGTYATSGLYKSGHWIEPNVLAHVRFNDRTDADGKKVLFIEELQSDWGQQGKKQGFGQFASVTDTLRQTGTMPDEWERMPVERQTQLREQVATWGYNSAVPEAPFVTDTKSWVTLAVKRMIAYAAQNGYEKVAFVTGEQSSQRYDLSKQVDSVSVTKIQSTEGIGFDISMQVAGSTSNAGEGLSVRELEEVVGKDLTEKIVTWSEAATTGQERVFTGTDLQVGGEGMKAFYDRIVPQVASDVLKKLGGGKLESVGIDTALRMGEYDIYQRDGGDFALRSRIDSSYGWAPNGVHPTRDLAEKRMAELKATVREESFQPGFTITDALRERVLTQGVPLFQDTRGSFDTATLTLMLNHSADASTFIHESGHFFLEVMSDLAEQKDTPPRIREDMEAVLDWLQVPGGLNQWNKLSLEEKRPYHEQFAKGFEAYLMTGKAPTQETEGLFARAKNWLVGIYRDISNLGVELSPKVTSVFDRMVTSSPAEQELENQSIQNGLLAQLNQLDHFPPDVNQTYATLVSRFYSSQAGAAGMSATELARRYPLSIRSDVHGLAPEGVSNAQTSPSNLKGWFGESKVVDAKGQPLVVYHGTVKSIDTFSAVSDRRTRGGREGAFFFTPNRDIASAYAGTAEGRQYVEGFGYKKVQHGFETAGNVMPVYLSLQRPLEFDAEGKVYSAVEDLAFDLASRQGCDGIIFRNVVDTPGAQGVLHAYQGDAYVAFSPSQIKSVFNRGTYDRDDPNILHQAAFHGSPHHFERFSLDHIGRGEGNQMYGWGLYFAGNKEVAEYYRTTVGGFQTDVRAELETAFPDRHITTKERAEVFRSAMGDDPIEVAARRLQYRQASLRDVDINTLTGVIENVRTAARGQVYAVEIPDDGEYLIWDKPLAQQPEKVQIALRGLDERFKFGKDRESTAKWLSLTGELPPQLNTSGHGIYSEISSQIGSGQEASRYLHGLGIAGIRYLDGTSRSAGEGTHNYVLFDDSRIQIREKLYQSPKPAPQPLPEGVKLSTDGLRIGKVKEVTADWVIQDSGRGALVGYPRSQFVAAPAVGQLLEITQRNGTLAVVAESQKDHGRGR